MKIKKEDTENENLKSKKRNAEKDVNKTLRHHCNELSDKEIESQANQIIEFLQLVHPHTIESAYGDAIEIRPVQRDADEFEYVRSYSTFTLTGERDKEELIKFLKRVNGKGFCVYYSLFAFDYNLDVFKDNGKLFGKGRVNKTNATYTTTLMADFDKVSIEDYESKYKPLFEKIIKIINNEASFDNYDLEKAARFLSSNLNRVLTANELEVLEDLIQVK